MENTLQYHLIYCSKETPEPIKKKLKLSTGVEIKESFFKGLEKNYPNIMKWYITKVVPGLDSGEREIILACRIFKNLKNGTYHLKILGYVILKKTLEEKKICTFRVKEQYQHKGIGKKLLEASFEFLGTRKPMITVSEDNLKYFQAIFKKYNFELIEVIEDLYIKGKTEYIYNERWKK